MSKYIETGNGYYTSLISDLKSNFKSAEEKINGLITLIDDLQKALDESSGDNIDNIKNDLLIYKNKYEALKNNIHNKLEIIKTNAITFDSWLKTYNEKKGKFEPLDSREESGLLGYSSTQMFRHIYEVSISESNGLIYIKYEICKKETKLWGAAGGGYSEYDGGFDIIDEMKEFI